MAPGFDATLYQVEAGSLSTALSRFAGLGSVLHVNVRLLYLHSASDRPNDERQRVGLFSRSRGHCGDLILKRLYLATLKG